MERLDYFADLVAREPDEPRARYGYANELFRQELWDQAVSQLQRYLELSDDEGYAWGRLGYALTRLDRLDDAADAYLTGIDQAMAFGHHGMADEFRAAIEAL